MLNHCRLHNRLWDLHRPWRSPPGHRFHQPGPGHLATVGTVLHAGCLLLRGVGMYDQESSLLINSVSIRALKFRGSEIVAKIVGKITNSKNLAVERSPLFSLFCQQEGWWRLHLHPGHFRAVRGLCPAVGRVPDRPPVHRDHRGPDLRQVRRQAVLPGLRASRRERQDSRRRLHL